MTKLINVEMLIRLIRKISELPPAKQDSCDGCKHLGRYENEIECGYNSPCTGCKRRVADNYEQAEHKVISIEDVNSALHQLGAYFGIVVSKNPDDKIAIEMYLRVHEIRSFFEKYLYLGSWIPSEQQKENNG